MVGRDKATRTQRVVVPVSRHHASGATAFHDAERRRRLIDAAEAMFLTAGYNATTMDGVARQAGMSKKTLYQVFGTKAALFEALLADRMKVLHLPVEDAGEPFKVTLCRLLCRTAEFALAPAQIAMGRLVISEMHRSPAVAEAFARVIPENSRMPLARWLALQCERGVVALKDPEHAASMLFGMITGDWIFASLVGKIQPPTKMEIAQRVERAVTLFLRGAVIQRPAAMPPSPETGPLKPAP